MAGAEDEDGGHEEMAADPRARLMQEVADQMDAIESDFGDDYQIGNVVTIVEILRPDGNFGVRVRSNAQPWVGLGLLRFAEKALETQGGED